MTSEKRKDWKGREAQLTPTAKDTPSHSWKPLVRQKSLNQWPSRKRWIIVVLAGALIILVAILIRLMDPDRFLRTYVAVLTPLQESADFDLTTATAVAGDIEAWGTFSLRRANVFQSNELRLADEGSQDALNKAQVIIVCLQGSFFPLSDGKFLCLNSKMNPDMDNSRGSDIGLLKSELEKHKRKRIVLIVDSLDPGQELRTGNLHPELIDEFRQWQKDLPLLTVVLSTLDSDFSEAGDPGTGGKSVFGHFLAGGLSSLADEDGNDVLTVKEFANYMQKETNRWVRTHRNPGWRGVVLLPTASDELAKRDHELLRDVSAIEGTVGFGDMQPDAKQLEKIEKFWARRQELRSRGADLWCPTLWVKCTDRLQRAERMLLNGSEEYATKLLSEAERDLDTLQRETDQYCASTNDLNSVRGVSRSLLPDLPSYSRCRDEFFPTGSAESAAVETGQNAPGEPEGLLEKHLKARFPNDANIGKTVDRLSTRRREAERLFAQVYDCFHLIPETLRKLDHDLLLDEDRMFVASGNGMEANSELSERITDLQQFAQIHGAGQTTLRRALNELPSLIAWASGSARDDFSEGSSTDVWQKVLLSSLDTNRVTLEEVDEIPEPVRVPTGLADVKKFEIQLRTSILKLALAARGLQQVLNVDESGKALSTAELRREIEELEEWEKKTKELSVDCRDHSAQLMAVASDASEWPMDSAERVRRSRLLRTSLMLTNVSEKTRLDSLKRIISVESSSSNDEKPNDASRQSKTPNANPASMMSKVVPGLWHLQLLKLVPDSEDKNHSMLVSLGKRLSEELPAADPESAHEIMAEFGKTVRITWRENRAAVVDAGARNVTLQRLAVADQKSRLLAGFDAQQMTEPLQRRLFQLTRIEYALMQVQRHLRSQWIAADTSAIPWYQTAAKEWLSVADSGERQLDQSATAIPESVIKDLQNLAKRVTDRENIQQENTQLFVQAKPGDVDLSKVDPNQATKEFDLQIIRLPADVAGEASFRIDESQGALNRLKLQNSDSGWPLKSGESELKSVEVTRIGEPVKKEDAVDITLIPKIFFRGRTVRGREVVVDLTGPPEYKTEILPPEQTANITVVGQDPRPVVLILDFSLSMGQLDRRLPDGSLRYVAAVKVLQQLASESQLLTAAHVTLIVFGHRYDKIKNVQEIAVEFKGRLWDRGSRQELVDRLNLLLAIDPQGGTPLFQAIKQGLGELKGKSGIVIAVTDGEPDDNGSTEVEGYDYTRELRDAISKSDATIRIVAFDVKRDPKVLPAIQATFDQFKDESGRNRILISDASEKETLKAELEASLDPRKFEVMINNGNKRILSGELGKSVELQLTEYKPETGVAVRFGTGAEISDITVAPGDNIRLGINPRFDGFAIEKTKPIRSKAAERLELKQTEHLEEMPTRLSQVIPLSRPADGASFTLMLDRDDTYRPVQQPEEIEFFVRSSNPKVTVPLPILLEQRFDASQGAPAWTFTAEKWPQNSNFLVDAFWKHTRTVPGEVFSWSDLKEDHTTRATAKSINSAFLPPCSISVKLIGEKIEVRLDPPEGSPAVEPIEPVQQIRVELGKGSLKERKDDFEPWKWLRVSRVLLGRSLVCEFSRTGISEEDINSMEVALTSWDDRKKEAWFVNEFRVR